MFTFSKWLELPLSIRIKLATHYGVVKKGSTHVFDSKVQSDGYDIKDVETMLASIQNKYPNSLPHDAIDLALSHIDNPPLEKKRGRPKKNAS